MNATQGSSRSTGSQATPKSEAGAHIMIVEDEESFVEALTIGLQREGFRVTSVTNGTEAIKAFFELEPDLVLLDLMLPGTPGIDVCRAIRARSSVPIVIVTAKGTEVDTVVGLEMGADDYITKPYRLRELVARLRAVLRRVPREEQASAIEPIQVGEVRLDPARHEVWVREQEVKLPLKEFELLEYLLRNAGHVLTRDALIDRVWGADYVGDTKTLDVHVKRLRSRLEEDPSHPKLITTIRGLGYRFERPSMTRNPPM
jgi:two-component system response regulator RegX3